MVIAIRERAAWAEAPRRRGRARKVSVSPAFSVYLRAQGRARCRSTEHSGRPPVTLSVTERLAADTAAAPPAIRAPGIVSTTRARLM
jgi:hypothetical protein